MLFIIFKNSTTDECPKCANMNSPMSDINTVLLYKHDGEIWSPEEPMIQNRGFLFGDGLFETMVFIHGKIRFSQDHEARLSEGLKQLGIEKDNLSSIQEIESCLQQYYCENSVLRVRWNVFREGRGKYTPIQNTTQENLQIQKMQKAPIIKKSAYLSENINIPRSPWSHCKTLSALTYVMANRERQQKGMDEVILLNTEGIVSEAGSSNIFWKKDGVYYTPSLRSSCIAGVGRKNVISHLKSSGENIVEGEFLPIDLLSAEKVMTTNVTGISYVGEIEGRKFDTNLDLRLESVFEALKV